MPKIRARAATLALSAAMSLAVITSTQAQTGGIQKINHVVVIYQENWSFDSLYGKFPGANGLDKAEATTPQVDKNGDPYPKLPQPLNTSFSPAVPDPRFPADMPVAPFDTKSFVGANQQTGDLVHRFYQEQYQIDGGKMDKFVAWSDAAGLVMSYYDATDMPEGKLAQQFTMMDNFFHGAFGGSFLNHQFLICACAPTFPDAPAAIVAQLDANGMMTKDGQVTPDGYVVNTSFSVNTPHPASAPAETLVPNQTAPTIGDRLSEKGVTWDWYSGGWNEAVIGHPDPLFQFHHQPFIYYANYADNTPGRADHLRDESDFYTDAANNKLPAVSFIKPIGPNNEHPGYATLLNGQQHVADLVKAVQDSPAWADTAIIITYDEHGGRWDHVPPPTTDKWGPGIRVPAIVISPFARKAFVDHTQYDTTAILKFIETRWGLTPLNSRDAAAGDLQSAFDFSQ
jgi:phospholipase C